MIKILLSRILLFFGFKFNTELIPEGSYCYEPDDEKNSIETSFIYHVKPCEYYVDISDEKKGCAFLGKITDDYMFRDQIKLCRIKP